MAINYEFFKQKLEEEKALVEQELERVGRRNPDNPADWEATPVEGAMQEADENDAADNVEEYSQRVAINDTLEVRYNQIKKALEKIASGTYGVCEVCNKEIESDRLEANPSATTCKAHME